MHPFSKKARFSETGNAKNVKKVILGAFKNLQAAEKQPVAEI